jgi:hypothetical protein
MTKLIASSSARYCRPCEKNVVARPRARFSGVGLVLVIALTLALISFSALIGPFVMFTLPLILVAGFAIGPLVSLVTAPETCPHCARELPFATRIEATHRGERERVALSTRARSSDMKAA